MDLQMAGPTVQLLIFWLLVLCTDRQTDTNIHTKEGYTSHYIDRLTQTTHNILSKLCNEHFTNQLDYSRVVHCWGKSPRQHPRPTHSLYKAF